VIEYTGITRVACFFVPFGRVEFDFGFCPLNSAIAAAAAAFASAHPAAEHALPSNRSA